MKYKIYNYRYAEEILGSPDFQEKKYQLYDVVNLCPLFKLDQKKIRKRGNKEKVFTTDQKKLNQYFEVEFKKRGWENHPKIIKEKNIKLEADFKKERVQIEVQFGNMARWYADVFKMQVSYSQDMIDVGIVIAPMKQFADTIDENIVYFERIVREIPYAKMSLTLPILIVGIAPKIPKIDMTF